MLVFINLRFVCITLFY